jgi:hypothetical protein
MDPKDRTSNSSAAAGTRLPYRLILAVSVILMSTVQLKAAPFLITDGSGNLLGANGVLVGTTLYDVLFVDGSCISLYELCNEVSDLPFTSFAQAEAASQALLDQVFLDSSSGDFDSKPWLTNGCSDAARCQVYTPTGNPGFPSATTVWVLAADNFAPGSGTDVAWSAGFSLPKGTGTFDCAQCTFAQWKPATAPVPEPNPLLLLSGGLGALGLLIWSRRLRTGA